MVRKGTIAALPALLALLAAAPAGALARALPLLPLARGQLRVLLGQSGVWQPQGGVPERLTLIGGAPPRGAGGLNAYVALQPASRPCAASAGADHARLLTIAGFYAARDLVAKGSPLAPTGGARAGVHAAEVGAGVLRERGSVRACVWVAATPVTRTRAYTQVIPLLNGLFAAALWATPAPGRAYAFAAAAIGSRFSYTISSLVCGATSSSRPVSVPAGQPASETISIGSLDCPTDALSVSFAGAAGRPFGTLAYTYAQALSSPAPVAHLGGCQLDGVAGLALSAARRYLAAVGCRVGRVLAMPYDRTAGRGQVAEAQVDGGLAPLAPAGTAVDLVIDG